MKYKPNPKNLQASDQEDEGDEEYDDENDYGDEDAEGGIPDDESEIEEEMS
jgi:hypothetical protein